MTTNKILYERIESVIKQNDTESIESMLTEENLSYSKNGLSFLERAAELGNNYILNLLWDKIPTTEKQQVVILKEAISNGQLDTVKFLLEEKNVNPNVKIAGTTPLFWAAQLGNPEIAQLLVNNGAENSTTVYGKTPADIANSKGHSNFTEVMTLNQPVKLKISDPSETQQNFNEGYTSYDYSPYIYSAAALTTISTLYLISSQKNSITFGENSNIIKFATSTMSSFNPYNALVKTVSFVSSSIAAVTKIFETAHDKNTADDFDYKLADSSDVYDGEFITEGTAKEIGESLVGAREDSDFDDDFGLVKLFEPALNTMAKLTSESIDDGYSSGEEDSNTLYLELSIPAESFRALGNILESGNDDGSLAQSIYSEQSSEVSDDVSLVESIYSDQSSEVSGEWQNGNIFYDADNEM